MISLEQWRASIGLNHSGSYRRLARIVGKRRRPPVTAYRLLWPLLSLLSVLVQTLFVVWTQGPYMLLVNGYSLFKGGLTRFVAFKKRTSATQLLVWVCALAIVIVEDACANLERSLVAMAILLIMSGDVEENPGPIGEKDLQTVSKYLSKLSKSDLESLGLVLGLYLRTIDGYREGTVSQFRRYLIRDWINEKDSVIECSGATWSSLVNALRSVEVSQNGIAAEIEKEQMHTTRPSTLKTSHVPILTVSGLETDTYALKKRSNRKQKSISFVSAKLGQRKSQTEPTQPPVATPSTSSTSRTSRIPILIGSSLESDSYVLKKRSYLLWKRKSDKKTSTDSKGDVEQHTLTPPPAENPSHTPPHPSQPSPQLSSPTTPAGDTPPQSVARFTDYLRAFYQRAKPTESKKWPPSPSKKFINLAAIRREEVSREQLDEFTIATLHGKVDDIIKIKAPIETQAILDTAQDEALECVLVEGAPGVGKTTLAWEICNKWAKRELFQQYFTVILLTLRGETAQKAKCIKDLIFYDDEDCKEEVTRYLKQTDGKNTLIILEGLDELPKHLLTQASIFTSLLSGEKLPQATILITSRPSATVQLWENWKDRMSRHIEVLGFSEQNIDEYITSVMSPKERPGFNDYLSLNSNIKLMMYIPIHAAIVIETYRYCHRYSRLLPTSVTELYTCLVQTILLRYLDSHPDYRHKKIPIQNFKDLPLPVYHHFEELMEMALEGVLNQQLTFPDKHKQIEHMGFMDVVAECVPHMRLVTYSYNFLHASVQEYLAAYSVSLKPTTKEQEQLLQTMISKDYLRNMGRFLAGITKFKNMDKATVKAIIEGECETEETDGGGTQLRLSPYTLQLVHESGDCSIIAGYSSYYCKLTDYNPLLDFSNLGHCIANSSYKWTLELGGNGQEMQSLERIALFLQPLAKHSNATYIIESIICWYDTPQCAEHLLMELPQNVLQQMRELDLSGKDGNSQPLPAAVFEFILSMMSRLNKLVLYRATISDSEVTAIAEALHANTTLTYLEISNYAISDSGAITIAEALHVNTTLTYLDISNNAISDSGVIAIAKALHTNTTLTNLYIRYNAIRDSGAIAIAEALRAHTALIHLYISYNAISDSGAIAIAEALHANTTLTDLNISNNAISDSGAITITEMLKHNNTLGWVNLIGNKYGAECCEALKKVKEIKKDLTLGY